MVYARRSVIGLVVALGSALLVLPAMAATVGLVGDFNDDALVNAWDIDMLRAAINSESPSGIFDLNDDSAVDWADFVYEVEMVRGTAFGDSNLDQSVDAGDLAIIRNSFGASGGWASGNFTVDPGVDAADLALIRGNFGFAGSEWVPRPIHMPVPPAVLPGLLLLGGVGIIRLRALRRA